MSQSLLYRGHETKVAEPPVDLYANKLGVVYSTPGGGSISRQLPQLVSIAPDTFQAGEFSTFGTALNFQIKPGMCGRVDTCILQIQLKESVGSSSVTPVVAPYLVDRIEINVNGGINAPVQRMTAESLYQQLALLSPKELTLLSAKNGLNLSTSNYASEIPIPAGGNQWYNIPLTFCLLNRINFKSISSPVNVQVYLRQTGATSSGSGTLQVNQIRLRLVPHTHPDGGAAELAAIKKDGVYHAYVDTLDYQSTQTLTAGSQTEIDLKQAGACAGLFISARSSLSATNSAIRNFAELGGSALGPDQSILDIVDINSNSIFGSGVNPTGGEFRGVHASFWQLGDLIAKQPIYPILFVEHDNTHRSFFDGDMKGYLLMSVDNGLKLRITPTASFTTGSYVVSVTHWFHRIIRQLPVTGEFVSVK